MMLPPIRASRTCIVPGKRKKRSYYATRLMLECYTGGARYWNMCDLVNICLRHILN